MNSSLYRVSVWYAWKELRRRPKRTLSFLLILCAILVSLVLLLLYMEAEWRADVMPDHEENYHFALRDLSDHDKEAIKKYEWVQAWYDIEPDAPEGSKASLSYKSEFRVRVTWDYVYQAGECARIAMDDLGIFRKAPYSSYYDSYYNEALVIFNNYWYGAKEANGMSDTEFADIQARTLTVDNFVLNRVFCDKTSNSYVIQRDFFILILMFCLFSAGAFAILLAEDFRRSLAAFGTMRALGFRMRHFIVMQAAEVFLIFIASLLPTFLISTGLLKLFAVFTDPMRKTADTYLFTVADSVPIRLLAILSLCMLAAAIAGAVLVCLLHRKTPIMSMLREEESFSVSFVAKTSDAFESAQNVTIYNRLYAYRARKTLFEQIAVIACMMPLPFHLFSQLTKLIPYLGTPEGNIAFFYTLLESLSVLITSVTVTVAASRSSAASRSGELGIFRALGADKATVKRITYPLAVAEGAAILLLALLLVIVTSNMSRAEFTLGLKAATGAGAALFASLVSELFGIALFSVPSVFGGVWLFLRTFFRKSVITSLREKE